MRVTAATHGRYARQVLVRPRLLLLVALLALLLPAAGGCVRAGFTPPDAAVDGGPSPDAPPDQGARDHAAEKDRSGEETDAGADGPPAAAWVVQLGGTGLDEARGVAVDGSGRVFVTGYFANTITIGTRSHTAKGALDLFLAAFDAGGKHVWSRASEGAGTNLGRDVAVDSSGNVAVAGTFDAALSIDGKAVTHRGKHDILLASFNNSGALRWATSLGGADDDYVNGVTIGAGNAVCLVGHFKGTMDDPNLFAHTDGNPDAFVACRGSTQGQATMARGFFAQGGDSANAIAAWSSELYFTGNFSNGIYLGCKGMQPHMAAGQSDVFWSRFSSDGVCVDSQAFGGSLLDTGNALVLFGGGGKVAVAGKFTGTMKVGATNLTALDASDGYLATFSSSGAAGWVKRVGGLAEEELSALAVDAAGNLYLAGNFKSTLDLDGSKATSGGGWDAFVASFTPAAKLRWLLPMGQAGHELIHDLAVDSAGSIYAVGSFTGATELAGQKLTASSQDGFLLKLKP